MCKKLAARKYIDLMYLLYHTIGLCHQSLLRAPCHGPCGGLGGGGVDASHTVCHRLQPQGGATGNGTGLEDYMA